MQKMSDCGLRPWQNLVNCILIEKTMENYQEYWNNCIQAVPHKKVLKQLYSGLRGRLIPVFNNAVYKCNLFVISGEDDLKKGTQLLEIYALEIQMYTAQKNNKKLKALYDQSLHIKSAIPHPLILGMYLTILSRFNNLFSSFVEK